MSDRPMRLKYLKTKMKIILCIFLLCITAVSVFGQSVELNGIVGKSIEFPAAVETSGKLMYSTLIIGAVTGGSFMPPRNSEYNGRLQWDSSSGLFSLSGLKEEDSGVYTVENDDEPRSVSTFNLTVKAVSVFGESQKLNGIVGKSIEFPTKVKTSGSLMYGSKAIGRIISGALLSPTTPEYQGRVQWDESTGLFSLSGLRLNDSGVYTVENTDGQSSVSTFSLTVWVPVSKSIVSATRDEYHCKLMCSLERGTGVTLSWYREGEKESISSSSIHSAPFNLSVRVERSGTYTCEAKNSVGSETSDPLTVGAHCTGGAVGIWQAEGSKMWSLCLVLIVMLYSHLV